MPAQHPLGVQPQFGPSVAISMPPMAPEEFDGEQQDRIKMIAYQALKYTALAAMTVSTTALLASGAISTLGGLCIIGIVAPLTISCGVYSAVSEIKTIPQIPLENAVNRTAQKVERAARSLLWASLVVGAIVLGFGGAGLVAGAMKIGAATPLAVLIGFRDITFALGFLIPFGKSLLVNANRLDNRLHSFIARIQAAIQQVVTAAHMQDAGVPLLFQALFALMIGQEQILWESVMPILEMLPADMDEKVKTAFKQVAPTLTPEQIKDLQRHSPRDLERGCPRTFTHEFLLSTLNKEQIDQAILPQLQTSLNPKHLDHIYKDLQEWTNKLSQFHQRYAAINPEDKSAVEEFHEEVTPILEKLSQHTNVIASFKSLLKQLPPPSAKIAHTQARHLIEGLRKTELYCPEEDTNNEPLFKRICSILLKSDYKSLKNGLDNLSNQLAAKLAKNEASEEEDLSEEAYMTLCTVCGFRLRDFKKLAPYYDCTLDMRAVSEALADRGISTREDLFKHKILTKKEKVTTEAVMKKLIDFAKNAHTTIPATSLPLPTISSPPPTASVVSPRQPLRAVPVDSDVPRGAPAPSTASQFAPSQYQRTMNRIALVANHVYHYTTSAALIGIQVFRQPLSTAAGFAYGILGARERHIDYARLTREWQTSPSYIGQSIPERARELWSRIFLTSATMWVGPIGGFISGMNHADAVRYYAGPLVNRVVQVN